jgi:hypothetical protein
VKQKLDLEVLESEIKEHLDEVTEKLRRSENDTYSQKLYEYYDLLDTLRGRVEVDSTQLRVFKVSLSCLHLEFHLPGFHFAKASAEVEVIRQHVKWARAGFDSYQWHYIGLRKFTPKPGRNQSSR